MKVINESYICYEGKWYVDMWDVESGDEVGWKFNERFCWEKDGKKYSGVVKGEEDWFEVYDIVDVVEE